jgi:hypothetical protein
MENKYRGTCAGCGRTVAARQGLYDYGDILCAEWECPDDEMMRGAFVAFYETHPIASGATRGCGYLWRRFLGVYNADETRAARDAELAAESARVELLRAELVSGGLVALAADAGVRSLSAVIVKVCGAGAVLESLSYVETCAVRDELVTRRARRNRRRENDATRAALGYLPCPKCDGSGAYWKHDGRDGYYDDGCFRCGGTGRTGAR